MADQKISELPSGGNIQGTDNIPIVRGGVNNTAQVAQILSDITTKQDISEKNIANGYAGLGNNGRIDVSQVPLNILGFINNVNDLNLAKLAGWYSFPQTATNVPPSFPTGSNFNIIEVYPYDTNNGTQIIYSADRDSTSTYAFEYIRSWEGTNFTNWFQATLTQVV